MNQDAAKKIKKQLILMGLVVMGMFGFCFMLTPLYSVFCKVTGLNGKPSIQVEEASIDIDKSRIISVELLATLNESLPDTASEFFPKTKKFTIHPGESINTSYWVKNLKKDPVVVQAVPSVSPGIAAKHVKKMECFCFEHQVLAGFEGKEMSLVFTLASDLPKHITTVSLAYTLFDVTP